MHSVHHSLVPRPRTRTRLQARPQGTDLVTTALMKWNALHTIPAQGGDFCHNTPVEYKRHLAVATFHQSGACWWWPTTIQIRFPNSLTTPTSSSKFRIGLGRLNGVKWYQVCLVWCYCFQKANVVHTSIRTATYAGFPIPFQSKLHWTHNLTSDYQCPGWMGSNDTKCV